MQPILAERSHPGRAIAFAAVLLMIAAVFVAPVRHRVRHREHHAHYLRLERGCAQTGYVFLVK
jgi:membrane protein YdbS with pleckstrin-like domain